MQDVTDFWPRQPFDLMLPTINGLTLEGNCDLSFLKGAKQVYSIIASDRSSYQQMLDYLDTQFDIFADQEKAIDCFCGD